MNASVLPARPPRVLNDLDAMRQSIAQLVGAIRTEEKMFGIEEVVRLVLAALYSGGHVLLEANPGLGKTELVKALGRQLGFSRNRIQFTPDLMPADITGSLQPNPDHPGGALVFVRGPVFTSLLLADEINRATPKTQAAMLEAMAEKQVTAAGQRFELPEPGRGAAPFMVLATQNPIDHEGTYELPEAQADRFMFKIHMPSPGAETLSLILRKTAGPLAAGPASAIRAGASAGGAVLRLADLAEGDRVRAYLDIVEMVRSMGHLEPLEWHIVNLVAATNGQWSELRGVETGAAAQRRREQLVECLEFGLGPRAATALLLGSKAWAALFGHAQDADARDLAQVLRPVLRHRLRLRYNWRETFAAVRPSGDTEPQPDDFAQELAAACVPRTGGAYGSDWDRQARVGPSV